MTGPQKRLVRASSLSATYSAGVYVTPTDAEAIEQARESYRTSPLGRQLGDVAAFRFYVAAVGDAAIDAALGRGERAE